MLFVVVLKILIHLSWRQEIGLLFALGQNCKNHNAQTDKMSHLMKKPVFWVSDYMYLDTYQPELSRALDVWDSETRDITSLVVRKLVLGVSNQVRHKPGCAATEDGWRLGISDLDRRGIVLSM